MKDALDVLAFAAHPDDVELCAGGTICKLVDQGYGVGIVDMTRGELGSRGTAETRMQEAADAAEILGISYRTNLGFPDGNIPRDADARRAVIHEIRKHRPTLLLINAPECRHPDHCAAAELVADAAFYSGLRKIDTDDLEPWRPQYVLHYMQAIEFDPTIIVDVSGVWERRMEAMRAYKTQFHNPDYDPDDDEPETFVSNPAFMKWIEARSRTLGYRIGADHGEGFLLRQAPIGTDDLVGLLSRERPFR